MTQTDARKMWLAMLLWALIFLPANARAGLYGRTVTSVQYNSAHTGWNRDEVVLTIDNVNPTEFGKKWTAKLNGQVYAAPLYVSGVVIEGAPRNALYVATEANLIYALDAETGDPLWPEPYFLGTPGLQSLIVDGCGSVKPDIGITSTPVIDLGTGTLYAVGLTRAGTAQTFKVAAVDIATGEPRLGWPVTINPDSVPRLDTSITANRGALVLANDTVYVPFGGYVGDCGPYHGWVVGIDKTDPTAPQLYYRTPGTETHRGSGMWSSGGLAADDLGYIYAVTGNSFKAPQFDYSNAVLRLNPDLTFSGDARDFFAPSNWVDLNDTDDDLGSSAAMLLPPQAGSLTPNMIFVAGKRGVGHLIDRDNLGGVATGDGTEREGVYSARLFEGEFKGVFSTAAYYEDVRVGPMIFLAGKDRATGCASTNSVLALGLDRDANGASFYRALWCLPSMYGAMSPVVTSAPGQTGVLWVVDFAGTLYAFNAATGAPLYNSGMVSGDELAMTANFLHFTAVDGRVFVGTYEGTVVAYGLRGSDPAPKEPQPGRGEHRRQYWE